MPLEDWDYLLESLNQYDNDIVGSIEMAPCMPAVMIRQASEFLFDTLKWPNRPVKARPDARYSMLDARENPES